jgi:hypothetical protein
MRERRRVALVIRSELGRAGAALIISTLVSGAAVAGEHPLVLAREGFFYVNGKPTTVNDREYVSGQMYVEVRIPAKKTKPYPIIMVHGGTMSGTKFHRHTRRSRGLGAIFRAPGLCGLCG